MRKPLFSVIIPTLNEEKFLPKLLDSLVAQKSGLFEVIVVDGSSKDKTVDIAKSYRKKLPVISVLVSRSSGQSLQRNLGAHASHGDYFVFIDADAVVMPYALSRMEEYIKNTGMRSFTSWTSPDGETAGDATIGLFLNMLLEAFTAARKSVGPGAFMIIERNLFLRMGGFNEARTFGEDYDLAQRITEAGEAAGVIRETLYTYSLRRVRREGKLKFLQIYARAGLLTLLTKKGLSSVPGYIMGGQLYGNSKRRTRSVLKKYQQRFRKLSKELLK